MKLVRGWDVNAVTMNEQKDSGVNEKHTVFLIMNGVNIISYAHEISNNVVCATSKASDQPADTRSLIRAFACRLNIL